jgi:tRNA U55 pseudouridine synthase TruB
LTKLVRTGIGPFELEAAASLNDLADRASVEDRLIPPAAAVSHMPAVDVGASDVARIRQGQSVSIEGHRPPEGETVLVLFNGELLAVGTVSGGEIRPRKVMADG